MSSRENILKRIKKASTSGPTSGSGPEDWMKSHTPGPLPARAQPEDPTEVFVNWAGAHDASIDRVSDMADVPAAVSEYLRSRNQPAQITLNPDESITGLPWATTSLETRSGPAASEDVTSVTPAFAAISETGTLMLRSGADRSTTLNFLPENHIVVLKKSQISGSFEEAWAQLRAEGQNPRTVNLITGPSRTADIAQTLYMGAHGPKRLHIILVDGE